MPPLQPNQVLAYDSYGKPYIVERVNSTASALTQIANGDHLRNRSMAASQGSWDINAARGRVVNPHHGGARPALDESGTYHTLESLGLHRGVVKSGRFHMKMRQRGVGARHSLRLEAELREAGRWSQDDGSATFGPGITRDDDDEDAARRRRDEDDEDEDAAHPSGFMRSGRRREDDDEDDEEARARGFLRATFPSGVTRAAKKRDDEDDEDAMTFPGGPHASAKGKVKRKAPGREGEPLLRQNAPIGQLSIHDLRKAKVIRPNMDEDAFSRALHAAGVDPQQHLRLAIDAQMSGWLLQNFSVGQQNDTRGTWVTPPTAGKRYWESRKSNGSDWAQTGRNDHPLNRPKLPPGSIESSSLDAAIDMQRAVVAALKARYAAHTGLSISQVNDRLKQHDLLAARR